MIYYATPFLFLLFFGLFLSDNRFRFKSYSKILFLACIPAILLVVLRGDVGTDKGFYQIIIYDTINGNFDYVTYEIGFKYLTLFLSQVNANVDFIIASVGFLTSVISIMAFSENKNKVIIFILIVFPYFFYDMTMNGLRYGLSFALSALAAQKLKHQKNGQFFIFAFSAVIIQSSSAVMLFLIYIYRYRLKSYSLMVILLSSIMAYTFADIAYFNSKADAYKELTSPTGISGLSPLFIMFALFIINKIQQKRIDKFLYLFLVLEVAAFYLSLFSYSGLRFQSLIVFTFLVIIANFQDYTPFTKKTVALYFMVGVLCFGLKANNFMNEDPSITTPFIPYKYYWEER